MRVWTRCVLSATGFLGLALGAALVISSGCGSSGSSCKPGSEGCPCFSNDTCNAGLTCDVSGFCVFSGGVGFSCVSPSCTCAASTTCAYTGDTIEACCTSSACEYVVGDTYFPCGGLDCSSEAQVVVSYCTY
jgi:hypothetical protein